MNSVHLVTEEKNTESKNQFENQAGCTSTQLAQHVRTSSAPSAQAAPRARSSARRLPRPAARPRVRPRAQRPVYACWAPQLLLHAPALSYACLHAQCRACAPNRAPNAHLRAQPRAQLPSLCCIVTQAYPGSQYSLYCNTNLLPTKLYCNTVSSQASHLYCNTLSSLTIQF